MPTEAHLALMRRRSVEVRHQRQNAIARITAGMDDLVDILEDPLFVNFTVLDALQLLPDTGPWRSDEIVHIAASAAGVQPAWIYKHTVGSLPGRLRRYIVGAEIEAPKKRHGGYDGLIPFQYKPRAAA